MTSKFKEFGTGAAKDVAKKLPYHLISKEGMDALATVLQSGIDKGYDPRNWEKGLPLMECHIAPALRHMFKYMNGEDTNVEVGKDGAEVRTHHLENALAHLMMAVTQIRRNRVELDDRPRKET